MLRRAFLRSTIASAGGVFACNREDAGTHAEGSSNGDAGREPQQECNAETGCEFFPQSVASGDPKPNSVVLWTRVVDEGREALPVELQLSTREDFSTRVMLNDQSGLALVAQRDSDFCLRVRVEDLDPAQTYFYRFAYQKNGKQWVSRIGRTRTAPAPDSEAAVHFAVMSCQDYGGRYYHVHRHLSHQDVDFVLFLGDYVYETTDDPSFQSKDPGTRRVVFDDAAGTLEVSNYGTGLADELAGEAAATPRAILAARSLDNYRQLYRTYRSDADLQRVHERFPMIAVWDDHEFSDDCYGETATYTAGREDEYSPERRANADQAWFEYMPVDYPSGPGFEFDRQEPFPDNLRLYRDFHFGKHLHLVITDLRRYRPDHVIPEYALPGAVAVTEQQLAQLTDEVPDWAADYIDIDTYQGGLYQRELIHALESQQQPAWNASQLRGNIGVPFVNQLIAELLGDQTELEPILDARDSDAGALPRGVTYGDAAKTAQYSSTGARYFLGYEAFELIARQRYLETGGASEDLLGDKQQRWFLETLGSSTSTWKIWGNEYALMRRVADLSGLPVPEEFRRQVAISGEDWDGAPNKRLEILEALKDLENLVVLTGDLHSYFVGSIGVQNGNSVIEFVAGAVSSATYESILSRGGINIEGLDLLAVAGPLLQANNPHMAYQNLSHNGYATVHLSREQCDVALHQIYHEKVLEPELAGSLDEHFATQDFRIKAGSIDLLHLREDGWQRWNADVRDWEPAEE